MRDTQNPETPQNKIITTQRGFQREQESSLCLAFFGVRGAGMGIHGEVSLLRVMQCCPIPAGSEMGHLATVGWALANSGD